MIRCTKLYHCLETTACTDSHLRTWGDCSARHFWHPQHWSWNGESQICWTNCADIQKGSVFILLFRDDQLSQLKLLIGMTCLFSLLNFTNSHSLSIHNLLFAQFLWLSDLEKLLVQSTSFSLFFLSHNALVFRQLNSFSLGNDISFHFVLIGLLWSLSALMGFHKYILYYSSIVLFTLHINPFALTIGTFFQ